METRETNGKALPSEAEMELRGQIEVHIEPPDNDTPTAGSKVSYNLVIFSFKKCAIKMGKRESSKRKATMQFIQRSKYNSRSHNRSIWILSIFNLPAGHNAQWAKI